MSQQQDQQHMHGERRQAQTQFQGGDRRQPTLFGETASPDEGARTHAKQEPDGKQHSDEMPSDPKPGDPGPEARLQEKIEHQRTAERDLADRLQPPEADEDTK